MIKYRCMKEVPPDHLGMLLGCLTAVAILTTGCSSDTDIDGQYGQRRGRHAASVNGTSVLAGMFEESGWQVFSWRRLSPQLDGYQAIVWFPDDFQPPTNRQRKFLEQWLADDPGRTLVYVGRDYDATIDYWQAILPETPADKRKEVLRRAAKARAEHATRRLAMPVNEGYEWFTLRRDPPAGPLDQLTGDFGSGVVAEDTNIRVAGQLAIPTEQELQDYRDQLREDELKDIPSERPAFETLLAANQTTLLHAVTKPSWSGSQILVVINGSFLLNLPLVNHQHRQLAGNVIRGCGKPEKVAFLESTKGGPQVLRQEPLADSRHSESQRDRTILAVHWFVLGLLYCLCVLPIFGRPRKGQQEPVADFGQHVRSLANLLQQTKNRDYAHQQISQYRLLAKRDSVVQDAEDANQTKDRR